MCSGTRRVPVPFREGLLTLASFADLIGITDDVSWGCGVRACSRLLGQWAEPAHAGPVQSAPSGVFRHGAVVLPRGASRGRARPAAAARAATGPEQLCGAWPAEGEELPAGGGVPGAGGCDGGCWVCCLVPRVLVGAWRHEGGVRSRAAGVEASGGGEGVLCEGA